MNLKLVEPTIEMKEQFFDFIAEWELANEDIVPYSSRLLGKTYSEWLEDTYKMKHEETCAKNFVPASTYFLVDDEERILGAINIRHRLNDYLLNYGGHIGYGIRPSQRRKGYAGKMLSMALPIARESGLDRVLITCDKTNIASAKTIIKNGGILENEVIIKDNELTQRYWIDIKDI